MNHPMPAAQASRGRPARPAGLRPARLLTVAEATLRDLARRRTVLALLFCLPMVFYLGRRGDFTGQAVRFLLLGLAFAVSTASMFATAAGRALDRRLRLAGYRVTDLYLGRLLAFGAAGLAVALPYVAVVAADQDVRRLWAVGLAMVLTVAVGAPLGMLLGSVLAREFEAALLLMSVVGAQMIIDPARGAARAMPFWSAREIGTYAIDLTGDGYLYRGLLHAACAATALCTATALLAAHRLRTRNRRSVRAAAPPPPVG